MHVPVLLREVVDELDLQPHLIIVDGTVGAGGHSSQIMKRAPDDCRLIGLDRDESMLARAEQVVSGENVTLKQSSYAELDAVLDELNIDQVDRVLLDLGLSSDQLADDQRGFGYETTGELDMRFDRRVGQSAADFMASATTEELERVFAEYGEERHAGAIAQKIVEQRQRKPITTADQLVSLITDLTGAPKRQQSHPATRVFQALRIAVNEELKQLETFLTDVLPRRLRSGGRALIISFHSLEDRLVKQAFREVTLWDNLTRKPIVPTPSEVRLNPRSRSAKLRIAVRKS